MDTVCRLYEVGRQRLAEEEEDEEDQVNKSWCSFPRLCNIFIYIVGNTKTFWVEVEAEMAHAYFHFYE